MKRSKISYLEVDTATAIASDESHWSTDYDGYTIDVELASLDTDRWTINVSVRIAGWTEDLAFTSREAARIAGERLGRKFVDELD